MKTQLHNEGSSTRQYVAEAWPSRSYPEARVAPSLCRSSSDCFTACTRTSLRALGDVRGKSSKTSHLKSSNFRLFKGRSSTEDRAVDSSLLGTLVWDRKALKTCLQIKKPQLTLAAFINQEATLVFAGNLGA